MQPLREDDGGDHAIDRRDAEQHPAFVAAGELRSSRTASEEGADQDERGRQ
jgi:hypothetical protein